jgi:hypothetical protein
MEAHTITCTKIQGILYSKADLQLPALIADLDLSQVRADFLAPTTGELCHF